MGILMCLTLNHRLELFSKKDVGMRKSLLIIAMLLSPTAAFAHEGHGGVGLFHHFMDLAPALALLAVIAVGFVWVKNRK